MHRQEIHGVRLHRLAGDRPAVRSAPEVAPEADLTEQAPDQAVLDPPLDAFRVAADDRLDVIDSSAARKSKLESERLRVTRLL